MISLIIRKGRVTIARSRLDIISKIPGRLDKIQYLPFRSVANLTDKFLKLRIADDVLNDGADLTFYSQVGNIGYRRCFEE